MALKPRHTDKSVQEEMDRKWDRIKQYVIQQLTILGIKAINHARQNRGYTDRTGNLVNSTGMIIVHDGKIVYEDFQTTFRGAVQKTKPKNKGFAGWAGDEADPTKDGITEGRNFLRNIAAEFSRYRGWALLIGAGMEYASTVEKYRGKNVLAATELMIRDEFPKLITQIKADISNMKL